jgi:DNA-binding FadR family transcriptional regulator
MPRDDSETVPVGAHGRAEGGRAQTSPLVQRVYQALKAQIASGDLRPDQKLPGENQLAASFFVSRPIVRDALQCLREEGLLYSRRGAGSFVMAVPEQVRDRSALAFAPVGTIADIQRCYEFRLAIEPEHAYQAARRWNAAALEAIGQSVDMMRAATLARRHSEEADFAFHSAIAEATNNHYYASTMAALKDHICVGMKFHGASVLGPHGGLQTVFDEHCAILEAIRMRDAERARETMRQHLEGSRNRIFEGRLLDLSL